MADPHPDLFEEVVRLRREGIPAALATIETFEAPWGRAAIVICEESWHPSVVHGVAMQGADALLVISNAPGRTPVDGDWTSQRGWRANLSAYARLYSLWIAYANRVGYEEGFVFGGGSAVIAPDGAELLVADPLEPEELTAKLDAGALRRARVANPAHGIERHELLIEALARAARPREASEGIAGDREEARP